MKFFLAINNRGFDAIRLSLEPQRNLKRVLERSLAKLRSKPRNRALTPSLLLKSDEGRRLRKRLPMSHHPPIQIARESTILPLLKIY